MKLLLALLSTLVLTTSAFAIDPGVTLKKVTVDMAGYVEWSFTSEYSETVARYVDDDGMLSIAVLYHLSVQDAGAEVVRMTRRPNPRTYAELKDLPVEGWENYRVHVAENAKRLERAYEFYRDNGYPHYAEILEDFRQITPKLTTEWLTRTPTYDEIRTTLGAYIAKYAYGDRPAHFYNERPIYEGSTYNVLGSKMSDIHPLNWNEPMGVSRSFGVIKVSDPSQLCPINLGPAPGGIRSAP